MGSGKKDRKCVSVRDGTARREEEIERGIALLKVRALLLNKSKRPTVSKSDPKFEAVVPISDLNESSIPDTEMLSEIVCVSVGDGTARREEEVERGIVLLKSRALLRNKSKRPTTSKSDSKFEVAVPISELSESSISDTGVPSEVICCFPPNKKPKKVFSGDENKAKNNDEIGDETVTSQKLSDTAVTSDVTFRLLFEECDVGEAGTKPEPQLAAEGTVVTCDATFELSFEEYDSGEEGTNPEPERAAAERAVLTYDETFELSCEEYYAGEERPKPEPENANDEVASKNAVHVRQPYMESTVAVFDDSDAVALPDDKEESTKLDKVLQSASSSANNCSTRNTSMPPSESANTDNCLYSLPEVAVSSFLSDDTKLQLELMGRFACTCADILFDDISVNSFQSLAENAGSAEDKKFGRMNTDSDWNENTKNGKAMRSGREESRKPVQNNEGGGMVSKEEVVEFGIELDICALRPSPKSEVPTMLPLDQKSEAATPIRDLIESLVNNCSTGDTSMPPSESANTDSCLYSLPKVVVSSFLSLDIKLQGLFESLFNNCSTRDTSMPPSESTNTDNYLYPLPKEVVSSFLSVDTKLQLELMGRFAYTCADILFDDISVESFQSLVQNAGWAKDKKFARMNTDSSGVDDTTNNDTTNKNKKVTTTYRKSINHCKRKAGTLKRKFGLLKRLTKRKESKKNRSGKTIFKKMPGDLWKHLIRKYREKNKSGRNGLKKISNETRMAADKLSVEIYDLSELNAVASKRKSELMRKNKSGTSGPKKPSAKTRMAMDMAIDTKDMNRGSSETGASTQRELRSVQKFYFVIESNDRPLRVWQVNADSSKSFWESGLIRMLENAVLPKKDDESYQSSLGHITVGPPDWGSAISELEDEGTIVGIFANDDDTLRHVNAPIFVQGQKGARPDVTSTSTEDLSQTDDEVESPKLRHVVQVATGDSIKTLETSPVWKVAVDPKTGRAYYYDCLTRVTTWSTPPDFVNK